MFIVIEIKPGKIQCFDCLQVVPHEMICVSVNHAMSLFIVDVTYFIINMF